MHFIAQVPRIYVRQCPANRLSETRWWWKEKTIRNNDRRNNTSFLIRAFIDFRRVAGLIKISKEPKYKDTTATTSSDALAIRSGLLTPARQVPCLPSSACNSLSFSRNAPPMTRGMPSDQSQGCLVSSHRYNKCHCVLLTLFSALISPRYSIASRLRTYRVSGHETCQNRDDPMYN